MSIEEILIIKNAHESYGISTSDINQISRVPMLMPLPLRPSGVRGLCAISGNIVSMVDMNLLLGMNEVDLDAEKSRIISLNDEYYSNALLVSEVYNTVEIKKENIDYLNNKDDDPVIAIYKYENSLIQIISLETLFCKINKVKIDAKNVKNGKAKVETVKEEDTSRFLIFSMAKEKYALHIDFLREIILSDVEYTDIAGSEDEVLGLITLRDELLLVIDLRKHYGFEANKSYKNRILVASHNGRKIGLLVDEIVDIKNYLSKDIEYMENSFESNKISGVIHDKDSLISFFDSTILERLLKQNQTYMDTQGSKNTEIETSDNVMEVIVFKLAGKEYAFDVENVAEIIDAVASTKIAYSDKAIDGIINIRGQIVTIVSLFEKLNIETKVNKDSKIIICDINDARIGFVVDSVSDILNVKESELREQEDELFTNILHLENGKRLVLSMDIDEIIAS